MRRRQVGHRELAFFSPSGLAERSNALRPFHNLLAVGGVTCHVGDVRGCTNGIQKLTIR